MKMKWILSLCIGFLSLSVALVSSLAIESHNRPLSHFALSYAQVSEDLAVAGLVLPGVWPDLKARGVGTVIDLLRAQEGGGSQEIEVRALGMHYVHIPVSVEQGLLPEQIVAFAEAFENRDPELGHALVFCVSGNRAAGMWTAYRLHQGVSPDIAFAEGRRAGLRPDLEQKIARMCLESAC